MSQTNTEKISLPYGASSLELKVPSNSNLMGVAEAKPLPPLPHLHEAIKKALENPLKSARLSDISRKGMRVAILTSDTMRPGDYRKHFLPLVLTQLHVAGVSDNDITILDAGGSHQLNTKEEWTAMYGEEILNKYKVINHNCRDNSSMINLGKSDLGDPVIVNRLLVDSDLCIGIGAVQPATPTCGYSGGVKIFAIGAAAIETIFATHRAKNYWHPTARSGIVAGNHFRDRIESVGKRIVEASRARFFAINAVTNNKSEIVGVYAGDANEIYKRGCELADKQWKVQIPRPADVLICSAMNPQASNPYEMSISMAMPIRYPTDVLKPGGVFIFVATCDLSPVEGTNSYDLLKLMRSYCDADQIIEEVNQVSERNDIEPTIRNFLLETRAYGIATTIKNCQQVLIAAPKLPGLVRDMHLTPTRTIEKAVEKATETVGKGADILVIPRTRSSLVYVR